MNYKVKKAVKSFFTLVPKRNKRTTLGTASLLTVGIYLSQLADLLTTKIGLKLGAAEANPLMKNVVESTDTFIVVKLAAATLISWFFWKRPTGAAFAIALYVGIAVNNLIVINRLM